MHDSTGMSAIGWVVVPKAGGMGSTGVDLTHNRGRGASTATEEAQTAGRMLSIRHHKRDDSRSSFMAIP